MGRDRRGVRARWMNAARGHLSQAARHPRRLGHRGQRAGHGVRQHGRRPRRPASPSPAIPSTGETKLLRRVPGQRPGRGRGGRHPHAAARSPRARMRAGLRARCSLEEAMPEAFTAARRRSATQLEKHYRDMQDIEFTVEQRQAVDAADPQRQAHRHGRAAASRSTWRDEGLIDQGRRRCRASTPASLDQLLHPTLDPKAETRR
ncbi:MAG: hypothetical protein MZV49_12525 [Rhodopseudomonas palustris]|nr:hypothetical protein [Rhodopseudomonas palustris]